jgi:flagellar basal body-associated protein FliL
MADYVILIIVVGVILVFVEAAIARYFFNNQNN